MKPKLRFGFWLLLHVVLAFCSAGVRSSNHEDRAENASDPSSPVQPPDVRNLEGEGLLAVSSPGLRLGSQRFHVNDGFFFHRQRSSGGRSFLRCVLARSNPPCHARAVMNLDLTGFHVLGNHNHGPDQLYGRVQQLRESILEACRARPNVRIDIIYHDVCRNVHRDVSSRVSLLGMRPSMVRAQTEHRPNIPYTFEELENVLTGSVELRQTLDGREDVFRGMAGQPGHRSIVFMSNRIIDGVGHISHLFGDATFFSRPRNPQSAQLYTFVTMRDNHVIPLLHALMESRTAQAYRDLFHYVRQLAPFLDPDFVVTDFELAQQQALLDAFPRSRLTGCLWHYARAVCRNVRSHGLHEAVRDNNNARRVVRLCLAIPLAPPGRLQEALNSVITEARRLALHDQFLNFFLYIRQTWILGVGEQVLSAFGVRHRTNNAAECHHRNLNARLVQRPNIWRFLELLTEAEDTAWRDLGRIEIGVAPSRARRLSSVLSDARVRSCSRQIMNREMDMLHFLSCVSWHLDGTMQDLLSERQDPERPPSPLRGPPHRHNNGGSGEEFPNFRNGGRNGGQFDRDFQPNIDSEVQANQSNEVLQSIDQSDLFESLMEDENAVQDHTRGRGRGRGRRGRGRGRGRGRNPGSAAAAPRHAQVSDGPHSNTRSSLPAEVQSEAPAIAPARPERDHFIMGSQDFSDAEDLTEDHDPFRKWVECIVCISRVGRYLILGCNAMPICGSCVRRWFVHMGNRQCPHCGAPARGWLRLNC